MGIFKNYKKEMEKQREINENQIKQLKGEIERISLEKEIEIKELKSNNNIMKTKNNHQKAFTDELVSQSNEAKNLMTNSVVEINTFVTNIASVGEEITASSEELSATTEEISNRVNNAHIVAISNGDTMKEFTEEIDNVTKDMNNLSDKIMNISTIVETIKEISSKTDLLSLNASIESARAGEFGKGFAVVASEIRKLADQAKISSSNISTIIEEIQKSTVGIIQKINKSNSKCKELLENEVKRIQNIEIIDDGLKDAVQTIINMTTAIKEQTNSMLAISEMIETLDKFVVKFSTENTLEMDLSKVEDNRYEITRQTDKVIIKFYGFLTDESMQQYILDYTNLKKSVNVGNTILVLDAKKLSVFPQEAEDDLGKFYCDYTNFKRVYMIIKDNKASKKQFERVWTKYGILNKFHFINSLEDIKNN
jgi:methyl-accepting chemotaxis protein